MVHNNKLISNTQRTPLLSVCVWKRKKSEKKERQQLTTVDHHHHHRSGRQRRRWLWTTIKNKTWKKKMYFMVLISSNEWCHPLSTYTHVHVVPDTARTRFVPINGMLIASTSQRPKRICCARLKENKSKTNLFFSSLFFFLQIIIISISFFLDRARRYRSIVIVIIPFHLLRTRIEWKKKT